MPLSPGTHLGRYEIHSQLGAGGMGEVYLATDSKLHRRAALKILPAEFCQDHQRAARFLREAQAASALNHPNICTIYEINDDVNDTPFIAMEYVEGETLSEKIREGKFNLAETLSLALQIADALAEAHAHGIVHRDIKPANIIVNRRGAVKILDFGLAKRVAAESEAETQQLLSEAGMILGTAAYMSPEQARGLAVDARTDVWSLGCVLYEMLTGRKPFTGATTTDLLASILRSEPESLRAINPEVPVELERIVMKTLRKERDERYESAKDLYDDLKELSQSVSLPANGKPQGKSVSEAQTVLLSPSRTDAQATSQAETNPDKEQPVPDKTKTNKTLLIGVLLSLLLLAAIGLGYWMLKGRPQPSAAPTSSAIESIAVMPFINASGNPETEYLSDGITESLINNLSRLSSLRVIARGTVFSFKGREFEPQQVGKQLNVRALLTGRVTQIGDTLSVQVDLVDTGSGAEIWGEQYHRKQADILTVQDEIAREVTDRLRLKLTGEEEKLLTKRYTNNAQAYEDYLKGRYHYYKLTEAEWHKALDSFNQAIVEDPNFALAYSGIADCYGIASAWLMPPTEAYPKFEEFARKALQIDGSLADARAEIAAVKLFYQHDWAGAEEELKHALSLNPNSTPARLYYSFYLYASGRTAECLDILKQGLESDPLSLPLNTNLAETFYYARRYDEALDVSRKMMDIDHDSNFPHLLAGWAYQQKGQYEAAIAEFQQARQLEDTFATAALGNVYAVSGQRDEAQKMLAELESLAKRRYVSPYFFALIYTGLGNKDQALLWLNKAYDERNDYLIYLKVEPLFDPLRDDQRFQDLMRRIGIPQ
ncbi:MAG TPA: protein kinase [Pyrinomonadaceae bacterium]